MSEKKTLKAITRIDANGKMLAIASDDSADRMGDSMDQTRWDLKNFKANPVLLAGHNYDPAHVIGIAKKIRVEGNQLLFEPVLHEITELSRNMKKMVQDGILKAWSVGFIPNALMDPENKDAKNELLEVSLVGVPANANALMIDAKSYKQSTIDEVEKWVKDAEDITKEIKEEPIEEVEEEKTDEVVEEKDEILEPKEKEGKVISAKNQKIIGSAVDILKQSVEALEKLVELQETPEKSQVKEVEKVEKPKPVQRKISEQDIVIQALKKIAGNSAKALSEINKSK